MDKFQYGVIIVIIFILATISMVAKNQYDRDQQFMSKCEEIGGYPKIISGEGVHERLCLAKDMIIDLE